MQTRLVLSQGHWVSVTLPKGRDPTWTIAEEYAFAAAYASAILKFSELKATADAHAKATILAEASAADAHAKATIVAEATVLRRMYPGLRFDKGLENDIQSIIPK
jgi:hypothetical protein